MLGIPGGAWRIVLKLAGDEDKQKGPPAEAGGPWISGNFKTEVRPPTARAPQPEQAFPFPRG